MKLRRILTATVLTVVVLAQFIPVASIGPRPASAAVITDWAQFVADVTVPDGTTFSPGATFIKTWRLRNIGTSTWTTSYALVFVSGEIMGAGVSLNLPINVPPGSTVDISVPMTAPSVAGHYRGYWKLRNAVGTIFGIGSTATSAFWVDINVVASATVAYDFVANYCSAVWTTGAGAIPCPGTDGDPNGFVISLAAPQLENGTIDSAPGLLVSPQNITDGYIRAVFPAFTVQAGDRFQSLVNCQYGAIACYVRFRLDYQIGAGPVQTLWTFREKYEGLFYRASIDLSALAGQNVTFILITEAYGSPTGDRAIWGAPRITRGSIIPSTPLPPPPPPPSACDRVTFIADITVPDGSVFAAGTPFTKTWRLRNTGTCTWTTAYSLVFVSGDAMSATPVKPLPASVAPGQYINLSVPMVAPTSAGHYRGYWMLKNAYGTPFGIGYAGNNPFWVDINVVGTYGLVYDFVANACSATWTSGAGALPCPGTDGSPNGFVLPVNPTALEDGTAGGPGLVTFPQNITDGYIQGVYPVIVVQAGDRFQSIVNCQYGSTGCYVTFRLDYQIGTNPVQTLKVFLERYEGLYYRMDVDLSALAGYNVKFILTVLAYGSPAGDRALWVGPSIIRLGGVPVPTATSVPVLATATPTLVPTETPTPSPTP
ncbi:MAG: NBR1-Ig-like domain-containing protein [Chloroflexota bacterium]